MFETPDTVFNNLELLVNPSSTAKKCSATEDCCRNPGGDRHPSSTVKYCSATGLLPNRQRGERPGVNGLPFSHRRKETPVFNKLQLLVNRRLRQNRRPKAMRSLRSSSLRSRDALHLSSIYIYIYNCERSELSSLFNARIFYYIYLFRAVRRAVYVLNVSTCI